MPRARTGPALPDRKTIDVEIARLGSPMVKDLQGRGYTNLVIVKTSAENARALQEGKIDAWYACPDDALADCLCPVIPLPAASKREGRPAPLPRILSPSVTAVQPHTLRRPPQSDVELMTEKQVLGFQPASRLEYVGDEHPEHVQDRKHRTG